MKRGNGLAVGGKVKDFSSVDKNANKVQLSDDIESTINIDGAVK